MHTIIFRIHNIPIIRLLNDRLTESHENYVFIYSNAFTHEMGNIININIYRNNNRVYLTAC